MKIFSFLLVMCLWASAFSKSLRETQNDISEEVYFYHYANKMQEVGTELKIGEQLNKEINKNLPWKFFIHGWTTSPEVSPWFHSGKEAYFTNGDYNIVFVNWSKPANQSYLESCYNAHGSGKYLGKFILDLMKQDVSLESMHLLGHSLGSHMVGFAGKFVLNMTDNKIGRITGLDPAGPYYELNPRITQTTMLLPEKLRLSKNDASFVDIIHTDSGDYGIQANIGHIDIHPNGGKRLQPGCEKTEDENCSHARSTHFFVESINNNNFVARECPNFDDFKNGLCQNNSATTLGEFTDSTARGNFYLLTNSEPPYAKGDTYELLSYDVSAAPNEHLYIVFHSLLLWIFLVVLQ